MTFFNFPLVTGTSSYASLIPSPPLTSPPSLAVSPPSLAVSPPPLASPPSLAAPPYYEPVSAPTPLLNISNFFSLVRPSYTFLY